MQVAVDISLYPLDQDFIEPIKAVIERFEGHDSIEVERNRMSTQIRGEYSAVMDILRNEIRTTFETAPHAVFAIKILNNPIN